MRPKDKMLIDCAAIDQAYAYLTKPRHLASVRVAGDVVELLTALEARDAEIVRLQTEVDAKSNKLALMEFWWGKSANEGRERCDKLDTDLNDALKACQLFQRANMKLNAERDEVFARCEKAEAERDEARKWAGKYGRKLTESQEIARQQYKENSQLRGKIATQEQEILDALDLLQDAGKSATVSVTDAAIDIQRKIKAAHREEIDDLRSQLTCARADKDVLHAGLTSALSERDSLRSQLATARNDALGNAVVMCNNVSAKCPRTQSGNNQALGASSCAVSIQSLMDG